MLTRQRVWLCDLCKQPLTNAGDRCNSGIHQGPDDPNGWKGRAVEYVKADCEWTEMVDYHLAQREKLSVELEEIVRAFDAWENNADFGLDTDHEQRFTCDADFLEYIGDVARTALAGRDEVDAA